jgi:hypothetical protein
MKSFKQLMEDVDCRSLLKKRITERLHQAAEVEEKIRSLKFSTPSATAKILDAVELIKNAAQLEAMHLKELGKKGRWSGHPDCKGKVI